ncbi:Ras GTPase-activating protein 1 [Rhizophlyctis rosea]|uniref:Ras GTPase-activating protein 1 n=1 Tax=Rhizophlyctis rosea TaxID=64517 RepID=A0AAD5SL65_9FUNG|nr:Ras GTPase-activating protein 1 [Rhizophlyctis rosea]
MTVTSALQYAEESLRQCREFASFFKKRQAVEAEYAKGLAKVYQSFQKAGVTTRPSVTGAESAADDVRSQILKTSVWRAFSEYVEETNKLAEAHRNMALSIQDSVIDPFLAQIKEMEVVRKTHAEKDAEYYKNLQDAFAGLRKAKREYEGLQTLATDQANSHSKAKLASTMKERDVEKLAQRAATASEKADYANEALQVHEELAKNAQEHYHGQLLPALYQDIKTKEAERCTLVRKALSDINYLEKTYREAGVGLVDAAAEHIAVIDVQEDVEDFVESHLVAEDSTKRQSELSARSLSNPLKDGKMFMKRGDFISGWKTKHFVLLPDDDKLYCFDSVDVSRVADLRIGTFRTNIPQSTKPREIISLRDSAVHNLDDSYFNRADCFQLVASTSSGRQVYNLVTGSTADKEEWMDLLRRFATCCARCTADRREGRSASSTPRSGSLNGEESGSVGRQEGDGGYRVLRTFHLSIFEAKEIPGPVNPYCIVLFDDIKQARTTTRSGEAPFWGETFKFTDLCPHFTRLRILIFTHNRLQKDVDVGYVSIPLGGIKPGVRVEQWYPIKQLARTGGEDIPRRGSMRVGILVSHEHVLPPLEYGEFQKIVMEPSLTAVKCLGNAVVQQREELAKIVLNLFVAEGYEKKGLATLLKDEIASLENYNTIFRGNSLTTKAVDQYMKMVGMEYLHSTLGPLIKAVIKSKDSCEIDETRVDDPEEMKRNQKRLLDHASVFWSTIQKSVDQCPRSLRELFSSLKQTVQARWPEETTSRRERREPIWYSAISGFIFLRFFCPAILAPKLFGIVNDLPDPSTARTLTLITKIIQALANLTEFGVKEPYMVPCNPFVTANLESMRNFMDTIASVPNDNAPAIPPRTKIDVSRQLEALYQLFSQHSNALAPTAGAAPNPIIENLISTVVQLNIAHQRFERDPNSSQQPTGSKSPPASRGHTPRGSPRGRSDNGDADRDRSTSRERDRNHSAPTSPLLSKVSERPPKIELSLPFGEGGWDRSASGSREGGKTLLDEGGGVGGFARYRRKDGGSGDLKVPAEEDVNRSMDDLQGILRSIKGSEYEGGGNGHGHGHRRDGNRSGADGVVGPSGGIVTDGGFVIPPTRGSSVAGMEAEGFTGGQVAINSGRPSQSGPTRPPPPPPIPVSGRSGPPPSAGQRKASAGGRALFRALMGTGGSGSGNLSPGTSPPEPSGAGVLSEPSSAKSSPTSTMSNGSVYIDAQTGSARASDESIHGGESPDTPGSANGGYEYFGYAGSAGSKSGEFAGEERDGFDDSASGKSSLSMSEGYSGNAGPGTGTGQGKERRMSKVKNRLSMMVSRRKE